MKFKVLICALILICPSLIKAEVKENTWSKYREFIYTFPQSPNLFVSALVRDDGETILKFYRNGTELIQTISAMSIPVGKSVDPKNLLTLEDVNFDGQSDLKLLNACGNRSCGYSYWWLDPKTGMFTNGRVFHAAEDPTFDPVKKEVTSHENLQVFCDGCSHDQVFKWNGSDFDLVRDVFNGVSVSEKNPEPNGKQTIIEHTNGKSRVLSIKTLGAH